MGGALGNRLDDTDRRYAAQTAQLAAESVPSGTPTAWRNPRSGHAGTVTPTRTYQSENGHYCREYQQEVTIGGEQLQSYGTACRQADGSWKIQS